MAKAPEGWEQVKATWIEVPKMGLYINQAAKCGNTALYRALCNHLGVKLPEDERRGTRRIKGSEVFVRYPWQLDKPYPKIAVIREPFARFESLWKNKARDEGTGCRQIWRMSPQELAEYLSAKSVINANSHWQPQASGISDRWLPETRLIPLDRWAEEGWPQISPTEYPSKPFHRNATEGCVPGYDKIRVRQIYSKDFDLWEQACEWTGELP